MKDMLRNQAAGMIIIHDGVKKNVEKNESEGS